MSGTISLGTPWSRATGGCLGWVLLAASAAGCGSRVAGAPGDGGSADQGSTTPETGEASADAPGVRLTEGADASDAVDATVGPSSSCPSPLHWSLVPGSPTGTLIRGSAPSDLWLVHRVVNDASGLLSGLLMRGDGTSWTEVSVGDCHNDLNGIGAVWVASPNVVLAAGCDTMDGQAGIHRWDGTAWTAFALGDNRTVNSFWGSSAGSIWGAESDGHYLGRWDGSAWAGVTSAGGGLLAGGAPDDFWLETFEIGILTHHAPSGAFDIAIDLATVGMPAPTITPHGCSNCLSAGWGSALDDIWFVGTALSHEMVHFDGTQWSTSASPVRAALRDIWGTSRTDVWAVGDGGTILHFDGASWTAVPSPTTAQLSSVWAEGPCDVWAIGDGVYHGAP